MSDGQYFEAEIGAQPAMWESIAASNQAHQLARAVHGNVVFVGSGSSLVAAQLGALALRRRGVRAQALAATQARIECEAYAEAVVIALSQSGQSTDLLDALDALAPRRLVALTNTVDSPLGWRADLTIDVGAGIERAVPASKSMTATAAIVLWAASLVAGDTRRSAADLVATAAGVRAWLASPAVAEIAAVGRALGARRHIIVLGSAYGLPLAREAALKLKEASYLHAEALEAGEFRHGSSAMVEAEYAAIAIADNLALETVARSMQELATVDALRIAIGPAPIAGMPNLGPIVDEPFGSLASLVTAQLLALHAGRSRGIDSDTPRGLTKALVGPGGQR